jgi:hypothetical protein
MKIYYVDIDGTICTNTDGDYKKAVPLYENIEQINKLYLEGNTVIYWTARGGVTGIDWYDLTKRQLDLWHAKYHDLRMGKPHYDYFICDKAINADDYFK